MAWRDMTEQELASRPEARLGGPLLWVVLAAAVVSLVAIGGGLLAFDQLRVIGVRYMIAVGFAGVWSAIFVAMTLLRLPATPVVASAGFVAWIAWRFAVALWSGAGWPLAVDLWAEAVLAAGFCGYMADGVRPNAYYRRRLPAA
ncbi:MAG TPA: hypothetical protein VE527_14610 [Reyranella sp.]|jgi:hypothetical protein|nr:hypothetical protein [Reyranella sp.]